MAVDRWSRVDLPVLEYVSEHGTPDAFLSVGEIVDGTGIEPIEVATSLDSLRRAGYLAGSLAKPLTGGDRRPWFFEDSALGERGLRTVGAWPSDDHYEALVALLDRNIEATPDPAEKSKLKALQGSVTDVGKQVIAGLLVEFTKGNIHL